MAGLLAFLWFLVLYSFMGTEYVLAQFEDPFLRESATIRIHPFGSTRMLGIIIPVIFMYRSVSRFKETEGEGFLSFGRAFRISVMFTFIYASLSGMLVFLFGSIIDGSFVEFANTHDVRLLELTRDAGEIALFDVDEQIELLKQRDLADFAMSDFWGKTTSGFLVGLIVAAIVKQKPPTFASDE